ncbi:hypothetical protein [Acinetobacter sp. WCHAc060025]|uniref:hypothetical protein n=1 Tax=Acinetobacter sp. WCHAc060025 TaxID=2518625 RepID=UPI001022FF57|nr:hypothetical protein [Acinetobacter sp. WCHAc060025]RZG74102.1 hypothetical protein EXE09_13770 [Acinetobacter sp. WCHAc060025]
MLKIILTLFSLTSIQLLHAKDIQISSLINRQAINCEMPNPMIALVNDVHDQYEKGIKVNKAGHTVQLGKNKYLGIQGYQYYKTKHIEQHDFAVNFNALGSKVIKIALQGFKSEEGESGIYYLVFQGKPATVTYHLRKVMGNDWNIESILEETPQGNSKLVCVYAG